MNNIVLMKFGSHLYGTDTPSSDTDYKGIFMPSKEQIYLGKIPKSIHSDTKRGEGKNTKDDVDTEMFSLHYFIDLACEGQTVALDMLHAPENMLLETSEIWQIIVANRSKFYTKNLHAFVGYARRQAAKYGIKGSRLNSAKTMLGLLNSRDSEDRLHLLWSEIKEDDYIHFLGENKNGVEQIDVCGRTLQETHKVGYAVAVLENFVDRYGARAEQAASNQGIDWKAVSHAIRAAFQVREILTEGKITFPLKEAEYIKTVKAGKLDYLTEVAPKLETMIAEVEKLSKSSTLPEKVDKTYWDAFVLSVVEKHTRLV